MLEYLEVGFKCVEVRLKHVEIRLKYVRGVVRPL